jgi:hypothetical protein
MDDLTIASKPWNIYKDNLMLSFSIFRIRIEKQLGKLVLDSSWLKINNWFANLNCLAIVTLQTTIYCQRVTCREVAKLM